MKPSNPIETIASYAADSQYKTAPSDDDWKAGTVPLDTLPAAWWNWMWQRVTTAINESASGVGSLYSEVLNVLAAAEITASETDNTQLLAAIRKLAQRVGTTAVAGSVLSSTDSGKVSIAANGVMTPNGMGVPTSLNTTSKTIVGAINELLGNMNAAISEHSQDISSLNSNKAPNNHASSATTYGTGTGSVYGHVKLSDSTSSTSSTNGGIAATPTAVKSAYDLANSKPSLTSSAAAALAATASAGSSSYAARADHVHTFPSLVTYGGSRCKVDFTLSGTTLTITTTTV